MMNILLKKVFLLLYIVTICIANLSGENVINYNNETIAPITEINATEIPIVYQCNRKNVSCGCGYSDVEINPSRIMTGEDAVEASWTMFVSLRISNNNKHICGGTLLSNLYVLTAAHCVKSFSSIDFSNLTIVAGITIRSDSVGYTRNIRRIYIHPNFTDQANRFINDIAILELDYRLLIDSNPILSKTCVPYINSSILNNQYSINDTRLVTIGWETSEDEQSVGSEILQQTEVFTIHNIHPDCSNLIKDLDKQFCAGTYQDRKGDFGGAIFQWTGQYWEQIGIVSYGDGRIVDNSTRIYTRLSAYVDWINKVLDDASLSTSTSTTANPNCALKHQMNIILSNILLLTVLVSLI